MSNKPKHKSSNNKEHTFEFVSPFPLETCIGLLDKFDGWNDFTKTGVETMKVDALYWRYTISRLHLIALDYRDFRANDALLLMIRAEGLLKPINADQTLITGKIFLDEDAFKLFRYIFWLIALCWMVITFKDIFVILVFLCMGIFACLLSNVFISFNHYRIAESYIPRLEQGIKALLG